MEPAFEWVVRHLALGVEACGALLIAGGAVNALYRTGAIVSRRAVVTFSEKKYIWRDFATWLMLGLEFELAADVMRTAITPTWSDIGQLAAIAVIRTFLNFFLERDLEGFRKSEERPNPGAV